MEYLAIIGAIVLELLLGIVIIKRLLGKQQVIPFAWGILFVVFATVYIVFVPAEWVNGCYIFMLLYIRVGYRVSWKDSLITTLLCVLLVGITELICFFPFVFIFNGKWSETVNNLLAAGISFLFWCVCMRKVPVYYLKKWCGKKEVWYIAVVSFSLILMLTTIINYNMTFELELTDYIYIIMGLILMWILSFRLMRYHYEERIRKKYFVVFESVIEQIRSRQHKFQNHLDAVYSLHKLYDEYETLVQEQRKYLQKLTDYEMPAEVMALKNPILIAHVYEKITEAQEAGLRIRMKLRCDLEKCKMDEIHMIEILGTLFDNAIQDMKQTRQTEFLVFEVEKENGIIIRVANPHEEMKNQEIRKMFERGYSTKGKNRGIGLHHVKQLIQKHKIELLVENRIIEEKNYICFSVMIGRSTPLA